MAPSSAEMSGQRNFPLLLLHFLISVARAISIVLSWAIRSRTTASFCPAISSTSWQMETILQGQQVPNLLQTETQLLRPLDEAQTLHVFRRVVPNPSQGFHGFGHEPAPLVIADGFHINPSPSGESTNGAPLSHIDSVVDYGLKLTPGGDADRCLHLLLRMYCVRRHAETQGGRLLCVPFLWLGAVPARSTGACRRRSGLLQVTSE